MGEPVRHVILDRDGVLNREHSTPLASVDDWEWEDGALDGLRDLATRRLAVSVATNQSAIGRGLVAAAAVAGVHVWLRAEMVRLGVDLVGIHVCPHTDADGCACRKPRPGLLLDAMAASGHPPSATVMIGDAERDLAAAATAGITGLLVRTGKGRATEAIVGADVAVSADLATAVRSLPA